MNAHLRAQFRNAILIQLIPSGDRGTPILNIKSGCASLSLPASADEIEAECEGYLLEEGFLRRSKAMTINPAIVRYELTAAGRGYLAAQGLA